MKIYIDESGVPPDLKRLPHWILWKRGEDKEGGRFQKYPCNRRGYPIDATAPGNWREFNVVADELRSSNHVSGIGICLTGRPVATAHGEHYLVAIDLDECVTVDDEGGIVLSARAETILKALNSYSELSPSGTGLRAFFYSEDLPTSRNRNGMEIYGHGRFMTVTGRGKGEIRVLNKKEFAELEGMMFDPTGSQPAASAVTGLSPRPCSPTSSVLETPEAIEKLRAALAKIPPFLDRAQWVRALLAVKAHNFRCGEYEARTWSQSAGAYDPEKNRNGYNEKQFDDVWRTDPRQITPATLYFMAKQFGDDKVQITYGDTFNGQVFAELHLGRLKYVYPARKWIRWDERRWSWCSGGEALEAAKATAQEVLRRAAEDFQRDPSSAEAKRKLSQAQQSFNLKRLEPMLICAAAETEMHVTEMSELDANPMLLGCRNGVIDLKNGQLLWPQPEMLITKQVDAEYHKEAPCPQWEKFLVDIMLGDRETIDYLQKAVGYTLTGNVSEELLHFAYGTGRNGKSVFANILRRLMNDYALVAPAEMLMQRDRGGSANNDVARLVGARLLLANETRNGQAMDDLALKTLVSTEAIAARFLHHEFFEFRPTHHIWMRGNHKPLVRDESEGAWRRIRLLPFELDLSPADVDSELEEKLWSEREGILSWAVTGCLRWQGEGLESSPRIRGASASYRKDCDLFGEFIDEQCVLDKSARVIQRELWRGYQFWCGENGVKAGSKKSFTRKLEERGVVAGGWQGRDRMYSGIRFRALGDETELPPPSHHRISGSESKSTFPPGNSSLREKSGNTPPSCDPAAEDEGEQDEEFESAMSGGEL